MTDRIFEDMRRAIMRGTGCTSEEATGFFAHLGLFFSERAKLKSISLLETHVYMWFFDLCSRAAVELDDEL